MMPTTSVLFIFSILICCSCSENKKTISSSSNSNKDSIQKDTGNKHQNTKQSDKIEILDADQMLFNGKFKRFFTLNEFKNVLGEADSTKLMSEEAPCSYIFESEDGKDDKYLYKGGSTFENSKQEVAVQEFRFTKNNYIKYGKIILNSSTTIYDLKKLFPNAMKEMQTLESKEKGKFRLMQLREDDDISDGHINLFIKNDKLYSIEWWFPC